MIINLSNKYIKTSIIIVIFISLLFILFNLFYSNSEKTNIKNNYIPTKKRTNYVIINSNDISLNNYISNKSNTLVIFWATWCSSCVEESNNINSFILNNPEIPVIIISHDKNLEKVEKFLKENNFNWFVILDTNRKIRESIDTDTKGIPATYLLNKDLNIISKVITQMSEDDFYNFYNLNFNK